MDGRKRAAEPNSSVDVGVGYYYGSNNPYGPSETHAMKRTRFTWSEEEQDTAPGAICSGQGQGIHEVRHTPEQLQQAAQHVSIMQQQQHQQQQHILQETSACQGCLPIPCMLPAAFRLPCSSSFQPAPATANRSMRLQLVSYINHSRCSLGKQLWTGEA
ncbi:uncharacterized protein LOC142354939 [Convolutriloba macropyga]|uniref:uncharacterized protein LOC142354939 n=1 Tax=Convolutriloba macropyga TaxID=536237 RepID=UPI003F51D799